MKLAITVASVSLLTGATLYPLFYLGIGRPVSWLLVGAMAGAGIVGIYLLFRFRKSL